MALGGYQIGEKFRTKGTDLQDAEKSIYFDGYGLQPVRLGVKMKRL